jgi:hypothetical protein
MQTKSEYQIPYKNTIFNHIRKNLHVHLHRISIKLDEISGMRENRAFLNIIALNFHGK